MLIEILTGVGTIIGAGAAAWKSAKRSTNVALNGTGEGVKGANEKIDRLHTDFRDFSLEVTRSIDKLRDDHIIPIREKVSALHARVDEIERRRRKQGPGR